MLQSTSQIWPIACVCVACELRMVLHFLRVAKQKTKTKKPQFTEHATHLKRSTKPKIVTIWSFTEKVFCPLAYRIVILTELMQLKH